MNKKRWQYCEHGCGKRWPFNDKIAWLMHQPVCPKRFWNGG